MSAPTVVLVGFMGAGKSTAAVNAARALGVRALDVDRAIEQRLGRPIADVFDHDGEAAFRAIEERVTLGMLAAPAPASEAPELLAAPAPSSEGPALRLAPEAPAGGEEPRVLALGGGALQSAAIRDALGDCVVVWIDIDLETAWARCGSSGRPLAADRASFARLYAERQPAYERVADIIVGPERSGAMAAVLHAYAGVPAGVTMLWAASASGDYPAYIGPGLLGCPGTGFWPQTVAGRRFLVTDHNAGRLHGAALGPLAGRVTIVPGEQSKTIAHAEIVWTELARAGMTRADVVVALGGGVVGDLAGFCAATYQRGVRVVQVPTTLVSQVDSAYGGKTGVDLEHAKNYVGAYHQPRAVIADTGTLVTLPAEELAAGYAEVVKTALLAGGALWERVRAGAEPTDPDVIAACAQTKLRIVARDERDGGVRQTLNLGHTVAHAIETVTGYATYRHGEAVALGLLAALRLSDRPELRDEVAELLRARGLPTGGARVDPDAVVMATARDKKRLGSGQRVPFVLLAGPGDARHGQEVEPRELIAAVRELTS
ncbi:MAG: iron-containing alcohol dehydrogenase [Solirubrobacteraceae bacterium]